MKTRQQKHTAPVLPLIQLSMLALNIIGCTFVMMLFCVTSKTICLFNRASEFIASVHKLPINTVRNFALSELFCMFFALSFFIRHQVLKESRTAKHVTLLFDFALNMALLQVTAFNYSGFMLWLLSSVIYYIQKKWKYPVLIAGTFLYLSCSFDLVSLYVPLYSVKDYIRFYQPSAQHLLFFIYYALTALNLVAFFLICIQVMRLQENQIEKINSLNKSLSRANEELKKMADIKEKMGETKERNRLAMEIHDTIGHSLTGISVGVDACIAILEKNPETAKKQLQVISSVAKSGIADIRRSVSTLQTDAAAASTLDENIRTMLEKTEKATGVTILYNCSEEFSLEGDEENTVFRIVQESVTNAIRHGAATQIRIDIHKDGEDMKIHIHDNGRGCENFSYGFGTSHMKERASLLHGTIDFKSGDGFTVDATIPIRQEGRND